MAIIPGDIKKGVSIETPQQQKTKKLVNLLVVVILITLAIVYFGFGGSGNQPSTDLSGQTPASLAEINQCNELLDALSSVELNNPIFKDKKFEAMVLSDRLPVVVGDKGRDNPFIPF